MTKDEPARVAAEPHVIGLDSYMISAVETPGEGDLSPVKGIVGLPIACG